MTAQLQTGWTEAERLAALDSYAILDTPAEKTFDDIVQLVCQLTGAPIAAVNLIADKRQWFKSEIGLGVREMPLDDSICKYAILQEDFMVIPDTLDDPRTNCNPLVTGEPYLRFYAGELLKTSDGLPLGTLCVLDTKPRPEGLTPQQQFALKTLAQQVLILIEMHKIVRDQQAALIKTECLEAEAYAGRERFQKLVDQAATGIVETDTNSRITLVNQKICEMLGYPKDELIGMTISNITHSASLEQTYALVSRLVTSSVSQTIEKQYRRKDGSLLWATSSVNALRARDGQFQGLVANIIDITERKQTEVERQQFVALAEHSNEFIGMADASFKPYFINSAGVEMVGLESVEQALGMQISDFFFPEDQSFILNDFFPRAMKNGSGEVEIRFRHFRTGAAIWMIYSVYVVRDAQGNVIGHATVSRNITDRKIAEQKLRETAQRLQFTLEASHVGDWQYDLISGTNYRSLRHDECFGYSEPVPEWGIEKFFAHVHPEDREPTREKFDAALRALTGWHLECRVIWPDSSVHWIAVHGSLHTENDTPTHALGIVYDITERKQREAALRDAQARLEANLNAGEVSTWVFDIQTNRMFADRNLAKLFAVSEADANGGPLDAYLEAVHPDDLAQAGAQIQEAIETGKPYQASYRVRNAAGEYHFVVARGKVEHDQSGQPVRMPGVVLDVTQQKLIEEELRAKEERYGALFNSIDEGFCIIEIIYDEADEPVDYRFLEANLAFAKHSGLVDAVGKTVREIVPDFEQGWIDLYAQVALTGQATRLIDHSLTLGRWFDVYGSRLGTGDSRKVAVLFNDITEQKHNEESLRKLAADLSESNRRKTEFLATLAHELRNPLAPLRTGLDLLGVKHDSQATVTRVREMMGRQVDHMTHLVNDLLDVARIDSGKVELRKTRVDLKSVVASAVETSMPLVKAKQHDLSIDLPDHPLWLHADLTRLAQVLSNLLSNAAKYTPPRGLIRLDARQEDDAAIISITDSGIGIPSELLSDVFDMFTQVGRNMPDAQGGLGIGLCLVRRLVELHDGTVSAISAGLGQGSQFTVRLPLAEISRSQDVGVGTLQNEPERSEERRLRILVVDDNVDALEILAELLMTVGHVVEISNDSRKALEMAQTFNPDVVMLDLGMPGMTGYEVARAMRKMSATQQVILVAITGWGAQEDRARTREAGFDHHLTKPVDICALNKLLFFIAESLVE